MNGNIDLYCDIGFLDKLFTTCPQTRNGIPHKKYSSWLSYFNLLCGKSDVVIMDVSYEEFFELCNKDTPLGYALNILLESHADGIGNLVCEPKEGRNFKLFEEDNELENYFSNFERTIFFIDREEKFCTSLEDDFGLIFISPESIYKKANRLFKIDRIEINSEKKNWDFLQSLKHPCNYIFLIDNFILSKNENVIEYNIKSLFDALLPSSLNKRDFNVTIKTEIPKNQNKEFVDRRKEKVKKWIMDLRSNYIIKVNIDYFQDNNHDRNLFTNYLLMDSGYGFVLDKSERRKGTKLTIFPITHPTTLGIINTLKKQIAVN